MGTLVTRRRVLGSDCRDCGRAVLVGPDADACGLTVRVDPVRLTRAQELACVVLGRAVYDHDDGRLYDRSPAAVVHAPTACPVPAHVCGQPVRGRPLADPLPFLPDPDAEPPF